MSPIAKLAEARLKGPKHPYPIDVPADLIFVGTFTAGATILVDFYWSRKRKRIYDNPWGAGHLLENQSAFVKESSIYRCMDFIKELEECLQSQNLLKLD